MNEGPGPQMLGADYVWSELFFFELGVGSTQILGADPTRVYFGVAQYLPQGNAWLTTVADSTYVGGIQLPSSGLIEFKWKDHGTLVCAPWYLVLNNQFYNYTVFTVQYRPSG